MMCRIETAHEETACIERKRRLPIGFALNSASPYRAEGTDRSLIEPSSFGMSPNDRQHAMFYPHLLLEKFSTLNQKVLLFRNNVF
jgi:hypothetical protein